MRVKNINGTGDNACSKCGSWLNHWIKHTGQNPHECSVLFCSNSAQVGAHVQKVGSTDRGWYIVPFCREHNGKRNEELEIRAVTLVSASISQTCGTR
ncbi:hypothetical protein [Photorhabdus caribbeanensis]|uniref:hypothetical protein n=1 Tax=Photorhabdus caribbeanensis TaxID=1004165 RepID=UPI001BD507B8|nr:hypothetical protein [Photorhabdus caribbeanensis]MBS9424027.1 hypothetical protein [Photorhabdus caribbeanensis]